MAIELTKPAELGAEEILNHLKEIIPEDAAKNLNKSNFFLTLDKIQREASKILVDLEQLERVVLKQQNLMNAKPKNILNEYSALLTKNIEHNMILLTNTMKQAYALISRFREFILNESIEYLIQKGSSQTIVYMELKDILSSMGLRVTSGDNKEYKLVMDTIKTKETIKSLSKNKFLPKEVAKEIQNIEKRIRSLKTKAEVLTRAKELGKNIFTIPEKGIEYVNINEGYLLEAALNIVTGTNTSFLKTDVDYYDYYLQMRKNNLAASRGGDFSIEQTQKLKRIIESKISEEVSWIENKLSLQLKKVGGKLGASVQSASTMAAELFNIIVIINTNKNGSKKVVQEKLKKYFTESPRAKIFQKQIAQELNIELNNIDETLLKNVNGKISFLK